MIWLGVLLSLTGCASVSQWMNETVPSEPEVTEDIEAPDGPPLVATVDVSALPEPNPAPEPLARLGNPDSYVVDGVTYRLDPVDVGFVETGVASWYGRKFHGRLTSSGEPFDMFQFTAAHKTMPIPAWVRVTNLENDQALVVRVNDRGPFKPDRVLDLSWAAAKRLGFSEQGTTRVRYEVLEVPTTDPDVVANPLVEPAQAILQVTAVSSELQAQKLAKELEAEFEKTDASVRVEPTGQGMFRVQVWPATDEAVVSAVTRRLVELGWSPQRMIAR
jgi:rare lipoprotein A